MGKTPVAVKHTEETFDVVLSNYLFTGLLFLEHSFYGDNLWGFYVRGNVHVWMIRLVVALKGLLLHIYQLYLALFFLVANLDQAFGFELWVVRFQLLIWTVVATLDAEPIVFINMGLNGQSSILKRGFYLVYDDLPL
jgi:hypothetical protein